MTNLRVGNCEECGAAFLNAGTLIVRQADGTFTAKCGACDGTVALREEAASDKVVDALHEARLLGALALRPMTVEEIVREDIGGMSLVEKRSALAELVRGGKAESGADGRWHVAGTSGRELGPQEKAAQVAAIHAVEAVAEQHAEVMGALKKGDIAGAFAALVGFTGKTNEALLAARAADKAKKEGR